MDLDYGLADLPGDITLRVSDQHASAFLRDTPVILAEQRLSPTVKYAGWVQVSREILADTAMLSVAIDGAFDRALRPWKYADAGRWPTFTPLPLVARFTAWWHRHMDPPVAEDDY